MPMFKPTQVLAARKEARVKGFRGPAIGILRDAINNTNEIELPGSLKSVDDIKKAQAAASAQKLAETSTKPSTAGLAKRHVLQLQKSKYGWGTLKPSKRDHALAWSPAPYERRDYTPWKHVIYSYNKSTTKNLPIVTSEIRKLASAYFNMEPKDAPPGNYYEPGPKPKKGPMNFKPEAHVSGFHGLDQPIRQDLLGKFVENQKSFMIPYRELLSMDPQMLFRHRANSVNVSMHVYDERFQSEAKKGPPRGSQS